MNRLIIPLALLLLVPLAASSAVRYIVVPNGFDEIDGNDSAQLPFHTYYGTNGMGPKRYQQVYHASQFSALPPGGAFVSRIILRPDCRTSGSSFFSNVVVRLSTTSKQPDNLSTVFSENYGPDNTMIYHNYNQFGYAPPVGSPPCPSAGTWGSIDAIDTLIPFFYNPAQGNLLMEIMHDGTYLITPQPDCRLDAHNVTNDGISRIVAYSRNATDAALMDSSGLVTMFEFYDIPTLNISPGTNGMDLQWRARSNVFRLQTSSDFSNGAQWNDIPGGYSTGFSARQVTIPFAPSQPPAYFRLIWQGPLPNP